MDTRAASLVLACFLIAAPLASGDEIGDLLEKVAHTSDEFSDQRDDAYRSLLELPADQVLPRLLAMFDSLPDEHAKPFTATPSTRLVAVLNGIGERADPKRFDALLVAAWPKATRPSTQFILLLRYGQRHIKAAEPIAVAVWRDPRAAESTRRWAAAALVRIDRARYRDQVLVAMESDLTGKWNSDLLEDCVGERPPVDALFLDVAVRHVQAWAQLPDGAPKAGHLLRVLVHYTRMAGDGSLCAAVRLAIFPREDADNDTLIRICLTWWSEAKVRYEPAAQERRLAALQSSTRPTTNPQLRTTDH